MIEQPPQVALRRALQRRPFEGCACLAEDAIAVDVFRERIGAGLACRTPCAQDRHLAIEAYEPLEDEWHAAEGRERGRQVGCTAQAPLAAAIVSQAARLEHRGQADRSHRDLELAQRVDCSIGGCDDAEPAEELLFVQSVLRHAQGLDRRMTGYRRRYPCKRSDRYVLEFIGNDVAARREARDTSRIVERARDDRCDLPAG